jgi:hypothetical protein
MALKVLLVWLTLLPSAWAFDHQHPQWDALLEQFVTPKQGGQVTVVNYDKFQSEHAQLQAYLDSLSAVSQVEYEHWSTPQQLAFLINAYNAFTIELILTKYPDLASIKDLGSWLQSPWKKPFFELLGKKRYLDEVEYQLIRENFSEPRIHFAVNCASIGCPALAPHAYQGSKLSEQLDMAARNFLSDASRNNYDSMTRELTLSQIFDWYGDDFVKASGSVNDFIGEYANIFNATPEAIHNAKVRFSKYDWRLNKQ